MLGGNPRGAVADPDLLRLVLTSCSSRPARLAWDRRWIALGRANPHGHHNGHGRQRKSSNPARAKERGRTKEVNRQCPCDPPAHPWPAGIWLNAKCFLKCGQTRSALSDSRSTEPCHSTLESQHAAPSNVLTCLKIVAMVQSHRSIGMIFFFSRCVFLFSARAH